MACHQKPLPGGMDLTQIAGAKVCCLQKMYSPRKEKGWGSCPAMDTLRVIFMLGKVGFHHAQGHQANTSLDLLPVLSPWAPTKVTGHSEANCSLCWACKFSQFSQEILQLVLGSGQPPDVSPKTYMSVKPRFVSSTECASQRRSVGVTSQQQAHH